KTCPSAPQRSRAVRGSRPPTSRYFCRGVSSYGVWAKGNGRPRAIDGCAGRRAAGRARAGPAPAAAGRRAGESGARPPGARGAGAEGAEQGHAPHRAAGLGAGGSAEEGQEAARAGEGEMAGRLPTSPRQLAFPQTFAQTVRFTAPRPWEWADAYGDGQAPEFLCDSWGAATLAEAAAAVGPGGFTSRRRDLGLRGAGAEDRAPAEGCRGELRAAEAARERRAGAPPREAEAAREKPAAAPGSPARRRPGPAHAWPPWSSSARPKLS
ncbi:unnamed protein product, partial [Prorocentrum cordatum]